MDNVRVIHHHESDGWWAESPDLDGWSVVGSTYAEVVALSEESVLMSLGRRVVLEHVVSAGGNVAA